MKPKNGEVQPLIGPQDVVSSARKPHVLVAGTGYMISSSLMLIANKMVVHHLPAVQLVLFLQLASAAVVCWILGMVKAVPVDPLEWSKIKAYIPAVVSLIGVIYCSMRALQLCNVETFIVVRTSTPIMVSLGDWLFLGRQLPSYRSCLSLLVMVGGLCLYTATDQGFEIKGYSWLAGWYGMFLLNALYVKHLTNTVRHSSNWERVYYLNTMSASVLFVSIVMTQEWRSLELTMASCIFLVVSCALGVGISYFSFSARHAMSAASFTVLGNVCKLLSLAINLLVWDKHANLPGLCAVVTCLGAAYFYQQAPMRQQQTE